MSPQKKKFPLLPGIEPILALAAIKHGRRINQRELADMMSRSEAMRSRPPRKRGMAVSSAMITNWKDRGGMPSEYWAAAAEVCGCTVDEIRAGKLSEDALWPFTDIPFKQFDQLDDEDKRFIRETIEDRIRRAQGKGEPWQPPPKPWRIDSLRSDILPPPDQE